MKRIFRTSFFTACMLLLAVSTYLVASPLSAYAGSQCSATCSNGSTISTPPNTSSCGCVDSGTLGNGACSYSTTSGGTTYSIRCS